MNPELGIGMEVESVLDEQKGVFIGMFYGSYCVYFYEKFNYLIQHNLDGDLKDNRCIYFKTEDKIKPTKNFIDKLRMGNIFKVKSSTLFNILLTDIDQEFSTIYMDINYIDVTDDRDRISFLPQNRVSRVGGENPWTSKLRQTMSIGAFFNKLLPWYKERFIEDYVNKYKFIYDYKFKRTINFQVVSGAKIPYWYNESRYHEGHGTLNKSCMRSHSNQKRFNIYRYNPDKVSMLILTNSVGKLIGRALLWNVDRSKKIYMDRIYTTDDFYVPFFENYCREHNLMSYDYGNVHSSLTVTIDNYDYDYYPYMDTFKILEYNNNGTATLKEYTDDYDDNSYGNFIELTEYDLD